MEREIRVIGIGSEDFIIRDSRLDGKNVVKSVNGITADENGNVTVSSGTSSTHWKDFSSNQ